MTDRDAFLAGIVANPEDIGRRLVFADFLDEQGNENDSARAEFIRVSCELDRRPEWVRAACACVCQPPAFDGCGHREQKARQWELWTKNLCRWEHGQVIADCAYRLEGESPCEDAPVHAVFRRGFVEVVRGPLAWLIGGNCETCEGSGNMWGNGSALGGPCPACHGTGHTPGHLREIVRTQPVTEVVVSDRDPYRAHWSDVFGWRRDDGGFARPENERTDELPLPVFLALRGQTDGNDLIKWWLTVDAAHSALSAAILSKAKESPT